MTQVARPVEHRRADLAGVGTGQLVMDVLGADRDTPLPTSASRTAARQTNGGQMTRSTGPLDPVRAAIVAASSPASAGVVCIFQLAAMTTGLTPESCQSRTVVFVRGESLDPLEGALDGRAMEPEPLGELAEGRLRRLPSGRGHEPHDRRLLGQPAVGLEAVDGARS